MPDTSFGYTGKEVFNRRPKEIRKSWYVLAEIERTYNENGIPFPYNSFEALTTESKPKLSELIHLQQLSPSTSRAVSANILNTSAQDKLLRENFLLITGGSGSGKSTLAVGIAVSFSDVRVYRYITPTNFDNRQIQMKSSPLLVMLQNHQF